MPCCSSCCHKHQQESSPSSRPRCLLIAMLTFWLLLTIARHIFDLVGKLWVPVAFNFLQILAIISGLFAACQPFRQVLLVMLILSCLFSFTYNVFLTLWYSNILVVDDHRKTELLSAGLPFSYSFFLRHTPFCESRFDLALSQWKQDEGCLIPYVYFEEFQACLHAAIALIVVFLSISTFCNYRDEKKRLKRQTSLFETASSVPRGLGLGRQKLFTPPNSLSLEIKAQSLANTMSAAMPKMPTSVYISNDCVNSYESPPVENRNQQTIKNGQFRKVATKQSRRKLSNNHRVNIRTQNQNQVNDGSDTAVDVHTDYSSMSTSEAGCGSISEGFHAAKSTALQTPGLSGSLEDEETANDNSVPSRGPASASFHNSTQKRADQFQSSQTTTNGDSLRTFVPTRGQFNNRSFVGPPRRNKNVAVGEEPVSSIDNNSLYSDYVKPKDWGIVQPLDRHLCLSNGNRCSPRTTQLVSFDPKSNTLIRVREHPNSNNASDDEDLRSVVAEDSAKAFSSRSCFKSPVAENYDVLQRSPTMINNDVLAQECSLDSAVPSLVAPVLPKTTNLLPFSTGKSPIFTTSTINPAAESGHHLQQESFTNNILENKRNQSNNKPPAVIRQRVPFPPPAALPSSSFNATNPNNFILYQMDRPSFDADSSVYNTEYWSFHRKNSEPENVVQQNQGIPKTNLLMDEQNHSSSSLSQSCNHQESPESWPIEEGPFTSFPAARNRSPRRLSLVGFSAASAIRLSSPNGDL